MRGRGPVSRTQGNGLNMYRVGWVVLAALLAVVAQAQETSGALKGRVTDSSGAVVPGAKVAVIARGEQRSAETDQTGSYTLNGIPAGTHLVRITATGFATFRARVEIAARRTVTLDAGMQIALEKQEVTVEGEAAPSGA